MTPLWFLSRRQSSFHILYANAICWGKGWALLHALILFLGSSASLSKKYGTGLFNWLWPATDSFCLNAQYVSFFFRHETQPDIILFSKSETMSVRRLFSKQSSQPALTPPPLLCCMSTRSIFFVSKFNRDKSYYSQKIIGAEKGPTDRRKADASLGKQESHTWLFSV